MPRHSSSGESPPSNDDVKWEELYHSEEYKTLVKAKRRFILPALVFFTIYYSLLLIIQGYFPDFASKPVIGSLNISYLYAVSQIPVAWILCYCFIRYSQANVDISGQKVMEKSRNRGNFSSQPEHVSEGLSQKGEELGVR